MPRKGYIFLISVLAIVTPLYAQYATLDWKMHDVGSSRHIITNYGLQALAYDWFGTSPIGIGVGIEFPAGSGLVYGARSLRIGGKRSPSLTTVSTSSYIGFEFFSTAEPWDSVWVVERGKTADIPYWPNYTPISDQDIVCRYSDYNPKGGFYHYVNQELHREPFYVDVIQTSHTWNLFTYDWIVFQYYIIPTKMDLQDIYVGIHHGFTNIGGIGSIEVYSQASGLDDCSKFIPEKHLGIQWDTPDDPLDDGVLGPLGTLVIPPENIDPSSLRWTYKSFIMDDQYNLGDIERYEWMTSGKTDQPSCDDFHILISFGPLDIALGDTLHFMSASILGIGEEGILENLERLERLIENDFKTPQAPPRPPLRFEIDNHQVTLRWDPQPGELNPESYIDSLRDDFFTESQPFEGYRVYKSSSGATGPWTLLDEFDIADNDYFSNTGLQHHYTDLGLLNNLEYWYTVTSFSKPIPATGFVSLESGLNKNVVAITPGTAIPETVGKVAVVPNPYRADVNYNAYKPPWEMPGLGRKRWVEQDRRIQFINIPSPCEIRIYTLAGDLVQTMQHNNPERGFADWNLVSKMGQTIASGIFLFSCEDKKNGKIQVGKFVVIK